MAAATISSLMALSTTDCDTLYGASTSGLERSRKVDAAAEISSVILRNLRAYLYAVSLSFSPILLPTMIRHAAETPWKNMNVMLRIVDVMLTEAAASVLINAYIAM